MTSSAVLNSAPRRLSEHSAIVATAIVFVGLTVSELSIRLLLQFTTPTIASIATRFDGWFMLPLAILGSIALRPLGLKRSIAVSLAIWAILVVSVYRFRGLWIWSGTFDAYWISPFSWLGPALLGNALGTIFSLHIGSRIGYSDKLTVACVLLILVAAISEYEFCVVFRTQIESVYPPSRALLLLCLFLICGSGLILHWRES